MRIQRACTGLLGLVAFTVVSLGLDTANAAAFTRSGAGIDAFGKAIPMGHEWLTRLSLLELIGGDPVVKPDPADPRKKWTKGKAKNTKVNPSEVARIKKSSAHDERYQSTYRAVLDAIIGERWVDIAGFNVTNATVGKYDCFDAVAQEPAEIQYDHYMRRYDDRKANGGVSAATRSQERFIEDFVNAAMAPSTVMKVWDGGVMGPRPTSTATTFSSGARCMCSRIPSAPSTRFAPRTTTTNVFAR